MPLIEKIKRVFGSPKSKERTLSCNNCQANFVVTGDGEPSKCRHCRSEDIELA